MLINFIKIIPIEDTFFIREKIPGNIKFSTEIIKVNYGDKSPFKDGDLIFFQRDEYLYIWFVKYKLDKNKINIPESYLVLKNNPIQEGFLIIRKKTSFNILVIKNGDLISQITYKNEPKEIDKKLKLLAKEYSLKDINIKNITKVDYKPDLKDLFIFANFKLDRKTLISLLLQNLALPASIFVFGLLAYKILNYKYLENIYFSLEKEYLSLKKENLPLKEKIRLVQEKNEFWVNFVDKELKYPLAIEVLYNVAKIVNSYEGFISSVSYTPNLTSLVIGLPKKRKDFIKKILETGIFKDVKILTTTPDRLSKDYEVLEIELYPKEKVKE